MSIRQHLLAAGAYTSQDFNRINGSMFDAAEVYTSKRHRWTIQHLIAAFQLWSVLSSPERSGLASASRDGTLKSTFFQSVPGEKGLWSYAPKALLPRNIPPQNTKRLDQLYSFVVARFYSTLEKITLYGWCRMVYAAVATALSS